MYSVHGLGKVKPDFLIRYDDAELSFSAMADSGAEISCISRTTLAALQKVSPMSLRRIEDVTLTFANGQQDAVKSYKISFLVLDMNKLDPPFLRGTAQFAVLYRPSATIILSRYILLALKPYLANWISPSSHAGSKQPYLSIHPQNDSLPVFLVFDDTYLMS